MNTEVYPYGRVALRVLAYRGGGWGNDYSPKPVEVPGWIIAERRGAWFDLTARVRYDDGTCEWLPYSHIRLHPEAWDLPAHLRIPVTR